MKNELCQPKLYHLLIILTIWMSSMIGTEESLGCLDMIVWYWYNIWYVVQLYCLFLFIYLDTGRNIFCLTILNLQFLSACCTARRKGHFSFWVCYKDSIPYGRCWAYQVLGLLYFPLCPQNPVNYCLKWKKSFVLQIGTWNNPFM